MRMQKFEDILFADLKDWRFKVKYVVLLFLSRII